MNKKTKLIVIVGIIAVLSQNCLGCDFIRESNADSVPTLVKPAKENYTLITVKYGSIDKKLSYHGSLVPKSEGEVYFEKRGGRIMNLTKSLGSNVKKGELLAELDTAELKEELKEAELNCKMAQIDYDEASAKGADSYEFKRAQLQLEDAKNKIDGLNSELSKSQLYSPVDGIIVFVADTGIGQYIDTYKTLFRIAPNDGKEVEIDEGDFASIKPDMKVVVNYSGNKVTGKVRLCPSNMSANVSENNRNFLRIQLDSPINGSNFGDTVNVDVSLEKKDNVIVISKNLVHTYDNSSYVNLFKDSKIVQTPITIGIDNNEEIEVISGLKDGDQITK